MTAGRAKGLLTSADQQVASAAVVSETHSPKEVHVEVIKLDDPVAVWHIKRGHSQNLWPLQSPRMKTYIPDVVH